MKQDLHALFARLHGADEAAARAAAETLRAEEPIVVSACLLGERVRYDGQDKADARVIGEVAARAVLPLCPEVLGGMGCPRLAVHFREGDGKALLAGQARAEDASGEDAGPALLRGAARADELARLAGAKAAILKERSPSCGTSRVHGPDGVRAGQGVFAARLLSRGIAVRSEEA